MPAKPIQSSVLPDEQMKTQLASGKRLVFEGFPGRWQAIEEQVERLGFGSDYFVSMTRGRHGNLIRVTPSVSRTGVLA
jgi:hypothetical protein